MRPGQAERQTWHLFFSSRARACYVSKSFAFWKARGEGVDTAVSAQGVQVQPLHSDLAACRPACSVHLPCTPLPLGCQLLSPQRMPSPFCAQIVLMALGTTACVVAGLAMFALQTKWVRRLAHAVWAQRADVVTVMAYRICCCGVCALPLVRAYCVACAPHRLRPASCVPPLIPYRETSAVQLYSCTAGTDSLRSPGFLSANACKLSLFWRCRLHGCGCRADFTAAGGSLMAVLMTLIFASILQSFLHLPMLHVGDSLWRTCAACMFMSWPVHSIHLAETTCGLRACQCRVAAACHCTCWGASLQWASAAVHYWCLHPYHIGVHLATVAQLSGHLISTMLCPGHSCHARCLHQSVCAVSMPLPAPCATRHPVVAPQVAISAGGALLFAVYLVFDIQMLMGKVRVIWWPCWPCPVVFQVCCCFFSCCVSLHTCSWLAGYAEGAECATLTAVCSCCCSCSLVVAAHHNHHAVTPYNCHVVTLWHNRRVR